MKERPRKSKRKLGKQKIAPFIAIMNDCGCITFEPNPAFTSVYPELIAVPIPAPTYKRHEPIDYSKVDWNNELGKNI